MLKFTIGLFFFTSLIYRSFLYIWDTNHLSVVHKANIIHFEACHFTPFMVSFDRSSVLMSSFMNLSFYGLYFCALRIIGFSLLFNAQ